jgi:hypothetical protein
MNRPTHRPRHFRGQQATRRPNKHNKGESKEYGANQTYDEQTNHYTDTIEDAQGEHNYCSSKDDPPHRPREDLDSLSHNLEQRKQTHCTHEDIDVRGAQPREPLEGNTSSNDRLDPKERCKHETTTEVDDHDTNATNKKQNTPAISS